MRGVAVIADDAQHVIAVLGVAGEGPEPLGHFGGGRVGHAGHDRGQRAGNGAAGGRVIGNAGGHQQAADIRIAEAERAVFVGQLRDLARRELRHHHRNFQNHGPQAHAVLVALGLEFAGFLVAEGQQVQRRQVTGGVVKEHVFRARIAGADRTRGRAGVPVIDRGVILQAGIGRGPGGIADLFPQFARRQRLRHLAVLAIGQVPGRVVLDRAQEVVGDAHRVVRVLPGDGEIGFRVPVGVVGREVDVLVALLGELDDPLDDVVRHHRLAGELDLALERRIFLREEAVVARALAIDAGLEDRLEVLLVDLGARDEGRDLLLFQHLPVDVLLDIRVIDVDDDHLGGAAADFQE